VTVDAEPVRLPERSLQETASRIAECEDELARNQERLEKHAHDYPAVAALLREVEEEVGFIEARAGMGASKAVAYLSGFCPADTVPLVERAASEQGWGLKVEEPGAEDPAPTLIRNPRWVNIIRPVFDFMGIAPGYDEVDISSVFLLFFSLFFGMIVGDAGYGLIFLALTLAGRKAMNKGAPQLVFLLLVMSTCTIVWGLMTGTFFSMSRLPTVLDAAKIDWLRDNDNIMFLCFLIGAIHLTIAHGWNALRIRNTPQALAQVGWICNTWAMFFVTRAMVLGHGFPPFLMPLFLTGVVLIAVFMTPFKALKREAFNHVMLPLDLISNFVDVISYVRLFAVGLATYAVGNAFNGMAVGGGVDGVVAGVMAALVLFLGHTLNIVMAAMGVLVHGIRLNTLEFSGHLGMQWTGLPYRPFKKRTVGLREGS
jgi:V/A-type H+-transporting ATPase subunit I